MPAAPSGFFSEASTFLNATPMFRAGGAMGTMGMPCSGGTTVIHRTCEPGRLVADCARHRAWRTSERGVTSPTTLDG